MSYGLNFSDVYRLVGVFGFGQAEIRPRRVVKREAEEDWGRKRCR